MNKYCLEPHTLDENNLGGCYYDRDDNWVFIDKNTTKKLTNTYKFNYDINGEIIPIKDRETVKNNIKSVRIAPNLLTTFYSDLDCTNIISIVGGNGLKDRGVEADAYGYTDVPNGINCIQISDEYYNLNENNNNNSSDYEPPSSGSSSLIWLQVLLWILIIISLVLVAIAYYETWKKSRTVEKRETVEKSRTVEKSEKSSENIYTAETYPTYLEEYSAPPLLPERPKVVYFPSQNIISSPNIPQVIQPKIQVPTEITYPSIKEAIDLPLSF